ncbi:MAG: FAD-dependent oxidoreductase, partial [Micrococcales bacterium]|nr:FAD-dependent oxidoreductase [Micrococcales bacterium]
MSTAEPPDVDVVIVGAGPAGMACAATLLELTGLTVSIIDAGHALGGQYWRQPAAASGPGAVRPEGQRDLHHDLATYEALRTRLDRGRATGRLSVRTAHHVWAVDEDDGGYAVHAVERGRAGHVGGATVTGRALVIATGAFDRTLPFPGWDLPGVLTAGGVQALLKAADVPAGRRVAIGGTGPFLLPVAAGLAR